MHFLTFQGLHSEASGVAFHSREASTGTQLDPFRDSNSQPTLACTRKPGGGVNKSSLCNSHIPSRWTEIRFCQLPHNYPIFPCSKTRATEYLDRTKALLALSIWPKILCVGTCLGSPSPCCHSRSRWPSWRRSEVWDLDRLRVLRARLNCL